jgi:hypothetical protein
MFEIVLLVCGLSLPEPCATERLSLTGATALAACGPAARGALLRRELALPPVRVAGWRCGAAGKVRLRLPSPEQPLDEALDS